MLCCDLLHCVAEGRVGVSAVCILGYNVNKGEEISLRLRTDDYAGFRKYLAIRQTLVHELTHNVSAPSCCLRHCVLPLGPELAIPPHAS